MRILHVISSLDPAFGGPTEVVRLLLNYGPENYTQEVVTLDDPGADFLREIGFPVHALGPNTSVYGRNAKLIPWLEANRGRFDGVVVHGMWQYTGYAVWRTMRGRVPSASSRRAAIGRRFNKLRPRSWCWRRALPPTARSPH